MPTINLETNVGRNLESLVDSNGLLAVVEALAEICYAKSAHIEENWPATNSELLARTWLANGRILAKAADKLNYQDR